MSRVGTRARAGATGMATRHGGCSHPRSEEVTGHERDLLSACAARSDLPSSGRAHVRRVRRSATVGPAAPATPAPQSSGPTPAPSAVSPSPAATPSAGCPTPLPRPATCAGARRSLRPHGGAFATRRSTRRAARRGRAASRGPVPLRGLPVPERLHADVAPRRQSGRCSCGSTAAGSPRTAPSTTTAPSSRRTASSSSRSTTGWARSASSRTRRSPRGPADRPATTA